MKDHFRDRKGTWKKGIKLSDLKKGDPLYISKTINGFMYIYECEFLSYEKGLVRARILRYYPEWTKPESDSITARPRKCYLVGKNVDEEYPYCHWCRNGEFI